MKISILAYVYSRILQNPLKEQLCQYYLKDNIGDLIKEIHKEYIAIVRRLPDIGGNKNIFTGNYLMGAYLIAAYKKTKNNLTIDDWNNIICGVLNNFKFIKRQMKKVDLLSMSYKNKIIHAGEWCKENENKYPTNWQVELKDKENTDFTHIVFTKCGLYILCKKEGVPEFTACLCATDYITMSFANGKLERPTTLAKGDKCCDFCITKL